MKKLLAMITLVAAFGAQAVENHFEFTVESSGPDMYACNAGIKHVNPDGSAGWGAGDGSTHTTNPGDYLQDVMQASWGSYDQWTDTYSPLGIDVRLRANGTSNFNALFGETMRSGAFAHHRDGSDNAVVLSKLKFELSSERYGTRYFVDVCYYGPRFHSGPVGTYFAAYAQVRMSNTYDRTYIEKAELMVRAKLKCDGDLITETEWEPVTSGALKTMWSGLNLGGYAKRKCVTRYVFKESNRKMRVNQEHGSLGVLWTEIVDPSL